LAIGAPLLAQDTSEGLGRELLRLGGFEALGDVEFQFPKYGALLPNGHFAVCESINGHFRLLFFDGNGSLLTTRGRTGGGPFERQVPATMCRATPEGDLMVAGPDGRWMTYSSTGDELNEGTWDDLRIPTYPAAVHGDSVFGCAWRPTGRWLVT
jgi:hypothetical protein